MWNGRKTGALALALVTAFAACDGDTGTAPVDLGTPDAPTLTRTGDVVEVSWQAVAGAESYQLQRDVLNDAGGFADIASGLTATRYTDSDVEEGNIYQYRVVAVRGADRSTGEAREISIGLRQAVLSGNISAGQTRTLSADTTYLMQGTVVVDSAGTLVIPAGTFIMGDANVRPTALLVRIGGRIEAEGTAEAPIVFTSSRPAGQRARGDWGGILIAGRSHCSFPAPCQAEGIQTRYGGNVPDDDSGILRYVRIEYAGFEVSPGNELNGLTLAGVGSGTLIEFIQVHYGADDGIEWFGGTVNVKYALITGADDDSFDYSTGWQGKGQFWIVQQAENAGDKGFEVDGNESNFTATPLTDPQIYNITLIGRGTGASGSNDAIQLRRGVRGAIHNAVLLGWGGAALDVDDQPTADHCSGSHRLIDDIIYFQVAERFESDADAHEAACAGSDWRELEPGLGDPTNRTAPNFVPASGSPALTGAVSPPSDGFFEPVSYLGAVAPTGTPWYQGWTTFAPN